MNTAETARKALEILDRDGWNQGAVQRGYASGDGRFRAGSHCIGGAWNLALSGQVRWLHDVTVYEPLLRVIREQYPDFFQYQDFFQYPDFFRNLGVWNDQPSISEADVRAILEKLAAT